MRLATFNVLHGRSLSDGLVVPSRLVDAVQTIDADVLGLQEVDREQPRSGGLHLSEIAADAMGAAQWRFVPALHGTPGERWSAAVDGVEATGAAYGVALISRLPVRSWHVIRLRPSRLTSPVLIPGSRSLIWLKDEPRIGLAAVVETPFGVMTVATTHLSFVPGWNLWQLRRLCSALHALPGPRLLIGDLNLPGNLPSLVSGWESLARCPTFPSTGPRIQFDHALSDGEALASVTDVQTPAVDLSDHTPLVVTLGR